MPTSAPPRVRASGTRASFAAAWLTCSVTTLICDTAFRRIAGRAAPETRGVRSGRGSERDGEAAEEPVVRPCAAGVRQRHSATLGPGLLEHDRELAGRVEAEARLDVLVLDLHPTRQDLVSNSGL